ncbi:MAG TPA: TldD/PmbA family protein [Vicinamibacterales bacterium]|jgi:TldD protein|nr:TldD/PmbA family protein [Vicinamibacterales bacterium]
MSSRRDFLRYTAGSALIIASSDLVSELLAQSPKGNPMTSSFKGLADLALGEARAAGCSYADIRFTRSVSSGVNASGGSDRDAAGGGAGGGRGGGFGRGGGGGSRRAGGRGAAGFGVRVIHSGVWGFASSPIVTEDEIRRIARMATDVARASAIAKRVDVKLAPVPAYQQYWSTPTKREPSAVSQDDKQAFVQKVVDAASKVKGVTSVTASVQITNEWKYFASSEGSYIEQETWDTSPSFNVSAKVGDVVKTRSFVGVPKTGGWEVAEESEMLENAERIANEAVEMTTAKPVGMGLKDLVLSPSHAMLTIHEIVAHATELDRVLGYEANYAGTSFVKLTDVGKLKYGSKLMNITADRTIPGGMATIGFDDDGVKTLQFPIVRDGILVGLQTNRETAPLIGDTTSKGCTSASSWRDYPFLRMPNVHLEPGPKGSPTADQIIADTKDGVLIDGRGSYSIDQQRYNGQFGGNCFWEIKNGKVTRMASDVTYNAITTDFWANLDAIGDQSSWRMFGTGGDAKGQPTQTNSISHGSPYIRIRKIMVGAAYA